VEIRGWATEHLLAALIARELADGELAFAEGLSYIPAAACRLAQMTHAPNLAYVLGPIGAVNPFLDPISPSSGDYCNLAAESVLSYSDLILMMGRELRIDVFFAGGLQIDAYGNCNLAFQGRAQAPTLRGPGSLGLPLMSLAKRSILYTLGHNRRIFVDELDFCSGAGFASGSAASPPRRRTGRGPSLVITPMATLDFDPDTQRMRLRSVHPDSTVSRVADATGFELGLPDDVPITCPPTLEEMTVLRQIDPYGVLGSAF
jgi:glutaconate CoA-transferase, subunit B